MLDSAIPTRNTVLTSINGSFQQLGQLIYNGTSKALNMSADQESDAKLLNMALGMFRVSSPIVIRRTPT